MPEGADVLTLSEEDSWSFTSAVEQPKMPGVATWFLFQGDQLLVWPAGAHARMPRWSDPQLAGLCVEGRRYLGLLQNGVAEPVHCFAGEVPPEAPIPPGMEAQGLRSLYPRLGDLLFSVAGRAVQLLAWQRTSRFCGQCGGQTEELAHERAMVCRACDLTVYPRLSPAIIIAVVRRISGVDHLLLARNHRFPNGRYSVIAGYVEPGETLEECAQREVFEEVGIRIQDIRYFGSQPWPFPNSLMIGFTARYASGEIRLEEREIAEAGWFPADALPEVPPRMSIARRLIDWFASGQA
jgi:NAD+ diphosphatase